MGDFSPDVRLPIIVEAVTHQEHQEHTGDDASHESTRRGNNTGNHACTEKKCELLMGFTTDGTPVSVLEIDWSRAQLTNELAVSNSCPGTNRDEKSAFARADAALFHDERSGLLMAVHPSQCHNSAPYRAACVKLTRTAAVAAAVFACCYFVGARPEVLVQLQEAITPEIMILYS
uniref:Uncharacterized protein n=2 Tax=Chrysotila carterae TaxID=13221 RepID=A0A7S4BNC4_CHRCT|mmetsp:Transcript_34326/g.75405  ORF Transcript_34326/g.75405 Transcript_34326/m.75405 type:complete len:175 (+) Transcript_34326:373-897(+)